MMYTKGDATIVVGGQFGSEAKGKVVSFLADEFDMGVRTGAPNAGHTVFLGNDIFKLQQVPASFVNPKCELYIGAGSLIDPNILRSESERTGTKKRIFIDPQAGIIEERHHKQEEELVHRIGSTGEGCGAALSGRIWRKDFKLAKDVLQDFQIVNVSEYINKGLDEGKNVIIEGTQGFGLSLYHGIYPFVTSRDTTAANFLAEAGISPLCVKDIILVIRTYPIRVAGNSGPLPNEISWEELSAKVGMPTIERTTVTGKIRRVAEFDMALVQKAVQVNRPTQIALQFLNYLFPGDEGKNDWNELSDGAKKYIDTLEKELNVPITLIGTGCKSDAMVDRRKK